MSAATEPAPRRTPAPAPAHALRPATRAELPAVLALLADEDRVVDPAAVVVTDAYERAPTASTPRWASPAATRASSSR